MHQRRRGRLRRRAGGELHRRRGGALARPVPAHTAVHHWRDQPVRAPQPAAPRALAGRHPGGAGPPTGAGAMQRLAQPASAAGREAAGAEQCRRRASGQPGPDAGRHRQHPRRQRIRPARGRSGHSGRRPQPHPLCHRHPPRGAPRPHGQRTRLHQPGGLRGQPAGRRARHAGAAEGAWRVDDALRIPAGALGAVGVLLLRRPRRPSRRGPRSGGDARTAQRVCVLQGAGHLSRSTCTDVPTSSVSSAAA